MKDTALAADIARAKNIDLTAATALVTKAELGKVGALTKAGIEVHKVTAAQDLLKASGDKYTAAQMAAAKATDEHATKLRLVDTLSKNFAGSAEAYGKTAAGAQERFGVAIENLEESLGKVLLPIVGAVANKFAEFATFLTEHTAVAKILVGVIGVLGGVLLAASVATKIAAASQVLLNIAMSANPIGIVILALVALGVGLKVAWTHSETFRHIVTGTFHAVTAAADAVLGFFRSNWKIIAVLISGPFAPVVALATDAFGVRSALVGAFNAVKNKVSDIVSDIVGTFGAFKRIAQVVAGAVGAIADALDRVVSAAKRVAGALGSIHVPHISLPHIPGTATGGIVTGPQVRLVGEAGPEAIIPLGRGGGGGLALGGGIAVNFFGPVYGDEETIGRVVAQHVRRALLSTPEGRAGKLWQ